MNQHKFDHVIALIGAALRHRQGQPWMYEALALALDAAGRPKAEIERAVMSAVDFVDNTADLMYIGAYLSQIGLHQRALQVYRQAAAIDPLRPEPYMLGLRAARACDDLDGLKWASLGILSQAWPKEQADVWQAGIGVAKEVLDKLRAEKRTKEADQFQAALDEAVARDCVAVVTWTGEADVDVLVEEPRRHGLLAAQPAHHRRAASCSAMPSRRPDATATADTAKSMSARRGSTAPTACWCAACGATSLPEKSAWKSMTHYRTGKGSRRSQENPAGQGRGPGGLRSEGRPAQGTAPRTASGQRRGRPTRAEPTDLGPAA